MEREREAVREKEKDGQKVLEGKGFQQLTAIA